MGFLLVNMVNNQIHFTASDLSVEAVEKDVGNFF